MLGQSGRVAAQTLFGSIVGTITDSSGAAVPGATIQVTETQTNTTRAATTTDGGQYTLSTLPPGIYKVTVTKQGFGGYTNSNVQVLANNVARVDAELQVGSVTQQVDVRTDVALLQTDRADVHTELSATTFQDAPQPTRTYQGVLNMVPGMTPPTGQLGGGTNNPSKSMSFASNGTQTSGSNVRIEGVSATNPWNQGASTFVPSTEAIETVNVVTNSPDAEQGQAGGASVTVQLKGGTNTFHGSLYYQNVNSYTEATGFFQVPLPGQTYSQRKAPHLVDNTVGGSLGGPIIKDKLFFFGSYEGSFSRQSVAGVISVPTPAMMQGDFTGSSTVIYDPLTGDPKTGLGKTQFSCNGVLNKICPSRWDPIVAKYLVPEISKPAIQPNLPGTQNNFSTFLPQLYNLHKIDTKFDYQATQKLRISARYGYQPYYNVQQPIFGPILGGTAGVFPAFSSQGAANYLQHGATLAVSSSATYVASPTLVFDATFGVTQAHQLLAPTLADQKYGSDVMGIPGANQGSLPLAGGMPNFAIANYGGSTGSGTYGYSYPPLEYEDPIFEYAGNMTKTYKSHNLRVGADISDVHMNHKEIRTTVFYFTGGLTQGVSLNPAGQMVAANANEYNSVADFMLGMPNYETTWVQFDDWLTMRQKQLSFYARDQWQANHKLTINYGVRWEYYPVPTRVGRGIEHNNMLEDPTNATMQICGKGGNPGNCGISVSNTLFSPNVGISYRVSPTFVVRTGFSLSPNQIAMGQPQEQNFPGEQQFVATGPNSYTGPVTSVSNGKAATVSNGFAILNAPNYNSNGTVNVPVGAGNVHTTAKNFRRGYVESWNLTLEKELPLGLLGSAGYVGTHVVNQNGSYNFNYGQLGGGAASQPLNTPASQITAAINVFKPTLDVNYHALQVAATKRMQNGLSMKLAYTWSKNMQSGYTGILIPQYKSLDKSLVSTDRTHNFIVNATYELPFGNAKPFLNHGVAAAILGGWSLNATFLHVSGTPFSVSASGSSCNCPGNTQRADQVKSTVAKNGRGVFGTTFFDTSAFAQVTTVKFGSAGYYSVRGPGNTNLDAAISRNFHIWERLNLAFRLDSYNVGNRPHFSNPSANASSPASFGYITGVSPLGRQIDQRYFRLGARFSW